MLHRVPDAISQSPLHKGTHANWFGCGEVTAYKSKIAASRQRFCFITLHVCVLFTLFLDRFGGMEDDLVLLFVHIHLDGGSILELATQQFHGERAFHMLLDRPS